MVERPSPFPLPAPELDADDGKREGALELAAGLVIADRFRLVRPLAGGGMGAVWLAEHTELETPCALKFMRDDVARSPELAARFKREAKAAAQIRSPNVVQILDHGVWQQMPYIAMELLDGEDLAKRLRRRRVLSAREVLAVAVDVGRALAKAHAVGLVHRDLKPSNIFLLKDDDREIAKVLDFGVAKATDGSALSEAKTTSGTVVGTPFYMSPEQLRAEKGLDHRADLWALSVVVYQCLTGKLPFRADVLAELIVKIMVDPPPVPSRVAPAGAVPPGFDAWWAKGTDRNPSKRFQSAKELTDALALALDLSSTTSGIEPSSAASVRHAQAGTSRIDELDAKLLDTATLTPSPDASRSEALEPPGEPRRKRLLRLLLPAAGLGVVGIVVVLTAGFRGEGPAASPEPSAPMPAAAAPSIVVTPAATAMAMAPPTAEAAPPTATASASAPPAPKTSPRVVASAGTTPRPAASASPAAHHAAPEKRNSMHEGVTDF